MNTLDQLRSGVLAGSQRLNLACGLTEFPPEIFDLADTLETLDLSNNALNSLPADLPRLHKLRVLFCANNQFTELPKVLGQCEQLSMVGFKANKIHLVPANALPKSLRWLILTDNQISELPTELGQCTQLQKLMLAGNQLQRLPEELANCVNLELIRIAANQLTSLPPWLLKLPRLAWLAYAGNPFCEAMETAALDHNPIADIAWETLQIQHKLGEGASGIIHHAKKISQYNQSVAVKLFKGALTSDGLPRSEIASSLHAGTHPNLIGTHGKVNDHPDDLHALVMTLVSPDFSNLAAPPSLASCTRDIYPANTRFTVDATLSIALSIASAAAHLHSRGVMHGDLYAHNILFNPTGEALLGDFGAASFIFNPNNSLGSNPSQPPLVRGGAGSALPLTTGSWRGLGSNEQTGLNENVAVSLQQIEVLAFARLLEELIARTPANEVTAKLQQLQFHCAAPLPAARPLFAEILQTLQAMST
ncbi:MAG: leucine-rich repeat-containing protein kinase family protein [Gallionellaceae bacterium]|nr:leucine-rich repeat-containing protein kinase family protein [Gallionellaceae bacterium]